jgi:hypothetical protein
METELAFIAGSFVMIFGVVILVMCMTVDIRDALRRIATALETRKGE